MIVIKSHIKLCFILLAWQASTLPLANSQAIVPPFVSAPRPLSFDDLVTLATTDPPPTSVTRKLDDLLATPFLSNEATARGAVPKVPQDSLLGPTLRIAEWNINRGENEAEVELALANPQGFMEAARKNPSLNANDLTSVAQELRNLNEADVIILDEVDDGVKRTKYHNVARDLARALDMNYVYGVEFIELNRIYLGAEREDEADRPNQRPGEVFGVDPKQYLGLEGSAILSRYPIRGVRIIRLPQKYDWYHQEVKAISDLEHMRRWTSETLFEERITRQVRRGGRMAIVADLEVPQSPTGLVTVVCPHLEDYTKPAGREQQLKFLLGQVKGIANPVVLAGDFNTSGGNARPVSTRRLILRYVRDYRFWARQALFLIVPVPGLGYVFRAANYFKNFHDPTTVNVPLLLGNRSRSIFDDVRDFRFQDGSSFDFSGDRALSHRHRGRTLADSNQREWKGFTPTFTFQRTFKGLVGRYKIDWFFVKCRSVGPATLGRKPRAFEPYFGRTLQLVSDSLEPRISDHSPITVNLPLGPIPSTSSLTPEKGLVSSGH
jgi:endonuclease/exonuclease/phosphatase family metal-dependent hydrolase